MQDGALERAKAFTASGSCWEVQELPQDAPVLLLLPGLTGISPVTQVSSLRRFDRLLLETNLSTPFSPDRRLRVIFNSACYGPVLAIDRAGGSHDVYVQHMVLQARRRGIRAIVFNGRGAQQLFPCATTNLGPGPCEVAETKVGHNILCIPSSSHSVFEACHCS